MSNELTPFPSLLCKEGRLLRRDNGLRVNRRILKYHCKSCTLVYSRTHFETGMMRHHYLL